MLIWTKCLNEKWFSLIFGNNEKYSKIIQQVDTNLEGILSSKSVDKIKSSIEQEFAKLLEPHRADQFLTDLKIRVEILSDIYKKITSMVSFQTSPTKTSSFRENLPKITIRGSLSKSPNIAFKAAPYQSVHFEALDEEPKKIFSPLNSDTKLVKVNLKALSNSGNKKDIPINNFHTHTSSSSTTIKVSTPRLSFKIDEGITSTNEFKRNSKRYHFTQKELFL